MATTPKAYTVTAITRMIKTALEESFSDIWVEGEISGYLHHTSGHRYFSLKDENAIIKVVMWRGIGAYLKFEPQNGQKVRVRGDITVYEKNGQYQLSAKEILPVGIGPLELAFRQLYEKLSGEGLFDEERKQPIPQYPGRIGVVTSPTGAAIRDIINIARRRNNSVQLIIYPAQVQGDGAEKTIAAGIEYLNTRDDIDLIIVGRGGGSLEDLWPFNTEITVRAIVASRVPVVSAVGHEIDTTLSDLAADLRAPTPSAAAELVVWSKADFREQLQGMLSSQASELQYLVDHARLELGSLMSRSVYTRPLDRVQQQQQRLDDLVRLLMFGGKMRLAEHRNALSLSVSRLDGLSPLKVLVRGYSVSRSLPDRKVLKSAREVKPGDRMETILADGRIVSTVNETTDSGELQ
ncbi:exodeoxyribonuclease VII large subunit [candidate division GN15 bacterium]|uniref:Exodeoxyribonuclease 7 large subunit n=1 Tax=candidate division GN15 bacterium TaxID=2072418 RepID=A0A855X2V2_9BACT|nr:MAG: exodeoxyribonuclease VII large subunit [candidate division GN15 bacterium]